MNLLFRLSRSVRRLLPRHIALLSAAMLSAAAAGAQQKVGFAYYDVDRLYDTLPSPFYDDEEFTPAGRLHWTAERYRRKAEAVAATLDSMAMPMTVVFGVENEQVVRDIAGLCSADYSYIHRTINSLDGMDFALFYYGDLFFPERVRCEGRALYVRGTMLGRKTVLLMCREHSDAETVAAEIREAEPDAALIVMGWFDPKRMERYGLSDIFAAEERAGRGHRFSGGAWRMTERVCVDTLFDASCGIYARRRLFDERGERPRATFTGREYTGGAGRNLPLFFHVWH